MQIYKTYKYLIKPTQSQREKINKTFEGVNIIHNLYVKDINNNKTMPQQAKDLYKKYENSNPEIINYNKLALINHLMILQDKKTVKYKTKNSFPKSFKLPILMYSKSNPSINDNILFVPEFGYIKMVYSRELPEKIEIKSITIIEEENRKYYVSVLFAYNAMKNNNLDKFNSIGIDYSSTYFAVDNNGNKYGIKHFYRDYEKIISKKQLELSRCKRNSNNYYKKRIELYNIYNNVKNRRNDYLHKLSTNLANKYDYIYVEDLELSEIVRNNNLGKATNDNAYGNFLLLLEYKMIERGKKLIKVSKWFPSTKTCSCCGYVIDKIDISERKWLCPMCNSEHDRDVNAAINIRNEGIRMNN